MEFKNAYTRRDMLKSGIAAGAALGVTGLGGLTILDQAEAADRMLYDDLPSGETAPSTGLQLRTIGLGVSVQDRFLNEFARRSGHETVGKVAGLTPMITEWLAGGYRNYDTNETNANRNAALWNAGLLQPIPVEKVATLEGRPRPLHQRFKALGLRPGHRLAAGRDLGRPLRPRRSSSWYRSSSTAIRSAIAWT